MTKWKKIPLESLCHLFADGDWVESKDQSLRAREAKRWRVVRGRCGFFKERSEFKKSIAPSSHLRAHA